MILTGHLNAIPFILVGSCTGRQCEWVYGWVWVTARVHTCKCSWWQPAAALDCTPYGCNCLSVHRETMQIFYSVEYIHAHVRGRGLSGW